MRTNEPRLLSSHSDIDVLAIGAELRSTLRHLRIFTVGELSRAKTSGVLHSLPDINDEMRSEVEMSLAQVVLTDVENGLHTKKLLEAYGRTDRLKEVRCMTDASRASRVQVNVQKTLADPVLLTAKTSQEREPSVDLKSGRTSLPVCRRAMTEPRTGLIVSASADISVLSLSVRAQNALRRSNVNCVSDLLVLIRDEGLRNRGLSNIWSIGKKTNEEIRQTVSQFIIREGADPEERPPEGFESSRCDHLLETTPAQTEISQSPADFYLELASTQLPAVDRQIACGLLHPDVMIGSHSLSRLSRATDAVMREQYFDGLFTLLYGGLNICDELEMMVEHLTQSELEVLALGNNHQALTVPDAVCDSLRSKEQQLRVEKTLIETIRALMSDLNSALECGGFSRRHGISGIPFVRIQSALLIARDMGSELSYKRWCGQILESGLLGRSRSGRLTEIDVFALLLAVSRILGDNGIPNFDIPENLAIAAKSGAPDAHPKS
jgi:hypothetical protein